MIINRFRQNCCLVGLFRQCRRFSLLRSLESSPVIISSNKEIYTNLALEHWLFTNLRFKDPSKKQSDISDSDQGPKFDRPVVLIWIDEPCIVIGRHQNPWIEAKLGYLNHAGIKLARRHSGGGCVYHDENNINVSIIGHKSSFENRQDNLNFLANILNDKYSIQCVPTKRNDLIHLESGLKVTGSAAKLGRFNCYHHFTLLINTDKENLYNSIRQTQQEFIKSNSSSSTRSKVINLKEICPSLEINQVVSDLAAEYSKLYQSKGSIKASKANKIEGDRIEFEGLTKFRDELSSWNWIYGMTPKFSLEKKVPVLNNGVVTHVKLSVFLNKGIFEKIVVDKELHGFEQKRFDSLIGSRFTIQESMVNTAKLLSDGTDTTIYKPIGINEIMVTYLLQMLQESNV